MEPYYAGWLSILPPVIAVVLALITKEVFSSLLIGILSGTLIYTLGMGQDFTIISTVQNAFTVMVNKVDFNIVIFCSLLGSLVYVIAMAGGSRAYGDWATKKIKNRKSALLSTSFLGAFIFIDDYFNCLTVGTVMRPISDKYRISRAKLAYIIDSTAAPVCIIAPISSWAAAVGSNLKSTGAFESEMEAFVSTIPWNFYALLCLTMVVLVALGNFDFGQMRRAEIDAIKNGVEGGASNEHDNIDVVTDKGGVLDMIVPILALIVFAVLSLLYVGGYWGADPAYHSLGGAFGNTSAGPALVMASFAALVVAFVMFVCRRLLTLKQFMNGVLKGIQAMIPANMILVLAWTISGVCRDLLQTPVFISGIVENDMGLLGNFLPAIIFAIAGFLSFSTGTAWGTFGILIPIVVVVAQAIDPTGALITITLSATLAGSVFGDHCSPISDTTILSSAGSGCVHIEHVSTQLPFALIVASSAFCGYVVAGFTHSLFLSLATGLIIMVAVLSYLHFRNAKLETYEEHAAKHQV
ncbi:MAG: Na+/H+ antiporter NhaC family protein [Anaerobiospirillum succiniciproducens]|uniref:Na+/H+ antiporter NhaC family protein n=1 Tax=Anaerobiospirillum succiniciproducens TaxID=13335 RepID=UPI0026DA7029|nr:Na+/H+ antiporter NhaC family protein [Anaerobiospirillum succiniciproducens]MDO4676308.1 Na+/H+ antiporter NhaC family protein [Anaerobiospirillum succiniciproducens]